MTSFFLKYVFRMAFSAMLKQEMGWFDLPVNGTGALCSRLSADASAIQGVSSSPFVSNFLSGLWFIWRLEFLTGRGKSWRRHLSVSFHNCLSGHCRYLSRMEAGHGNGKSSYLITTPTRCKCMIREVNQILDGFYSTKVILLPHFYQRSYSLQKYI